MEDPKQPSPPPNTTRTKAKNAALVNLRSFILKCVMASAPNMLSQKDQIEQRIQELVPSCPTPDHPPYDWMIRSAITLLNGEGGWSAESISEVILGKHKDSLPLAHATFLKHHLKKLCENGFLVVNDDGLYFLGRETNQPEPKPATDSDPSLDNGFESDSTSSSDESFSPIMEMEMNKRYKDKTGGKRKNVHCRTRDRKRDFSVGIELEQKKEVDEERIDETQRIVCEQVQKRKRGRPRKIITTNSNQTVKPPVAEEALFRKRKRGRPRKIITRNSNQTVKPPVAEEALMGQDKVVADNQNKQNGDQEFRPKNSDDTANITRGEQSNEPEPTPATDPDPSLDYGYEYDSTYSSGERFSPIMKMEMSKRCKGKTGGKRIWRKGKNVHCRTRSREMDLLVGIDLKQENEVSGERIDEPQRVVCENSISRVRTGKQGPKRKRGRPRKNITTTTSSNQTSNPRKKLGGPRKNAVNMVVAEEALMGQDEVVADNQNKQNEDQEFRPQNEVYTVDTDDTANISRVEQPDEDSEDMDLIVDHVCAELQAANKIQSCTIEDEVIRPRIEEQHRVQVEKDLVNNSCQVEPSTMLNYIVPEEQNCEPGMEWTESLQKYALIEETEKSMNITEANEIQNQPGEHKCEVIMERTASTQNYAYGEETGEDTNETEAIQVGDLSSVKLNFEKENQNEPTEVNACDEEIERYINWQMVEDQACEVNGAELQEQEYEENRFPGESEEENHLKDACEFVEERDQAITERYQPEVNECDEEIECYINWQMVEGQACEVNGAELQEQEYEENIFPGESEEENHLKDACEFVEERDQAITERYQPDKENEGLEIFDKQCKQGRETGSEQYPSQKSKKDGVNEGESQQSEEQNQEIDMHGEYEIRDEAQCASEIEQIDAFKEQEENEDMNKQLKEQRQDACPSQRLQEDGVDKSKSQQLEEQNQEIEMHEEYENLDQARQLLEKVKICASKVQEKNEDVNQQLNEVKQDGVKIGEDKGVSERMMVIEKSVKFGERLHDSMLECEQNSVSEMELEGNCAERTNALEQRSDTRSAKKSHKVEAVNAMQQVEKRQLRPRSNKAQPIESKAKRSITVPSLEKYSETNQRKKLRVSKQLEHGTRRSLRLQKSRSGN